MELQRVAGRKIRKQGASQDMDTVRLMSPGRKFGKPAKADCKGQRLDCQRLDRLYGWKLGVFLQSDLRTSEPSPSSSPASP